MTRGVSALARIASALAVCCVLCTAYPVPPSAHAQEAKGPQKDQLDQVIDKALKFLQKHQDPDGSWPAARGGRSAGITALGVMAFLSAGHVPGEGPYAETVEKGIRAVMKMQQANGLLSSVGHGEMYHHGICTLMHAEVVGMTDGKLSKEVKERLKKAVKVILNAQRTAGNDRGGWRYMMGSNDADISVTGWQLLALRAAKNVGCDVPPERIEWACEYMNRC